MDRVLAPYSPLKGFLEGRVVFTPQADRAEVEFVGRVRMGPLLTGAVLHSSMVSPTGHVSSALLTRVYLLLQAYATLKIRALGRWRAQLATPG